MKNNQKGFSLVEIIVVIAILGILTATTAMLSFSLVSHQNVNSCASEIEGLIGQTKTHAMSRNDTSLTLWVEANGVFAEVKRPVSTAADGMVSEVKKVGKAGITAQYLNDSGTWTELNQTTKLELTFNRSSGAFSDIAGTGAYCEKIKVVNGDYEVNIVLIPQTGKYYIE